MTDLYRETADLSRRWLETDASVQLHARASGVAPKGVQGDARYWEPYPMYFRRAEGSRLWDVDGNEFLDLWAAAGPIILGHNDPRVLDPVIEEVKERGVLFCLPHEREIELAEKLCSEYSGADMAVYGCGGSDVLLFAVRAARTFTGRQTIVKCEGAYHGWNDPLLFSVRPPLQAAGPPDAPDTVSASAGLNGSAIEECLVVPYNDAQALERIVMSHRNEIAAVFMEPVLHTPGSIAPEPGYLEAVREICSRESILLVFDEIITGFRHAIGGFQSLVGVTPDLTALGKAMSNGFPLSALVGRRDVMETLTPSGEAYYSGTFMGQSLLIEAGLATLATLKTSSIHERLFRLGNLLAAEVNRAIGLTGALACFQHVGSVWALYFGASEVTNYRDVAVLGYPHDEATRALRLHLRNNGFYFHPATTRAYLMDAHSEEDIERLASLMCEFITVNRGHLR